MSLSGWGRVAVPGIELRGENLERISTDVPLTRGLARSYGDSSLPPADRPRVAASVLADRILGFDSATGVLHAESGLTLGELNRILLPRKWASPVHTGTQYVTLGGMVAADVHGKNHHRAGCFGEHVSRVVLKLANGRVVSCGPDHESELFRGTIGGMGLTGHILEVEFALERIPSPWIWCESRAISNIDEFLEAMDESAQEWPFTVGWVDCLAKGRRLGRGVLLCGRWAEEHEAPSDPPPPKWRATVPFVLPGFCLNDFTVKIFNEAYYRWAGRKQPPRIAHPDSFFHPLDVINDWNRIYGPRGFTQYQCVIPSESGHPGVRNFFSRLADLGGSSFLSVIKDCGDQGSGLLSFPRRGTSIALDLKITDKTPAIVSRLNRELLEIGGRVYLAKDLFTSKDEFAEMEPRLGEWQEVRRRFDPDRRITSLQAERLLDD